MGKTLSASPSRYDTKINFGLPELGVGGGKDDIACEGKLTPSTKLKRGEII